MARSLKRNGCDDLKAEINVTPLVDVVLVLLIIFIVVTPMLTRGRQVQLPVAVANVAEEEVRDPIVLTITSDKRIWLDEKQVRESGLSAELRQVLSTVRGTELLIKADAKVSVRELRPLLRTIKSVGISQISFAVLARHGGAK